MKYFFVLLVAAFALSVSAQQTPQTPQAKIGAAVKKTYKKTKKQVNKATHYIGEAVGLETVGNDHDSDDVKIKGYYYMPLYERNLYHGTEAEEFRRECLTQFKEKYPNVEVLSVAIPQTDWVTEDYVQNGKTIGFGQYMYCFIIAKDADDGYINARFVYRKMKEAGGEYAPVTTLWGKWERTDVMNNQVYNKLKKM